MSRDAANFDLYSTHLMLSFWHPPSTRLSHEKIYTIIDVVSCDQVLICIIMIVDNLRLDTQSTLHDEYQCFTKGPFLIFTLETYCCNSQKLCIVVPNTNMKPDISGTPKYVNISPPSDCWLL